MEVSFFREETLKGGMLELKTIDLVSILFYFYFLLFFY